MGAYITSNESLVTLFRVDPVLDKDNICYRYLTGSVAKVMPMLHGSGFLGTHHNFIAH